MIARRSRINRRAFLRGIGTAGVALPFLESIPERSAWAATENPVFGLFICTSCGVVQQGNGDTERFWPTQLGALTTAGMQGFAADRCTGILADHASRLLIVKGVRYPYNLSGCGHAQGLVQCLTASQPTGDANNTTSTGPSADTVIASALNAAGVDPLTLYAGTKRGYIEEKLSFSAAGQVRAAEGNPYNVLQRLSGLLQPGTDQPTGMGDQLALRRNSVNDLIRQDTQALLSRPELSKADRDRINQHLQTIRDMEVTMGEMGAACSDGKLDMAAIEALNSGTAFQEDANIEQVVQLQIELAALAFSCNATRVATIQCGDGTDPTRYTINGTLLERFHWVSHRIMSDGDQGATIPNAAAQHAEIDRLRMGTFKAALDKFAEYSTANGPLLDNAFAMWTSHVAAGPSHGFSNLPIIIAGSAGGFLKQGQYIDAGNATNNRLLNTLISACGVPTENFGGGGLSGGLIDGMLA